MRGLLISVLILLSCGLFAEVVGEVTYVSGDVAILRDEESYDFLDPGMEVENYDLIQTSSNGEISIRLESAVSPTTEVKVQPNTAFTIELNDFGTKKASTIEMLTGSIALKVNSLTSSQDFNVRSESTVMGVRGTAFVVESTPGGDILVSCDEGSVECSGSSGKKVFAKPGTVVEQRSDGEIKGIPVSVTSLKQYRKDWLAERVSAFKANALRAIKNYANLYDEYIDKFKDAYSELMENEKVIKKWLAENKKKQMGDKIEIMREKKALIGPLFKLRRVLFMFEKVYFRLVELKGYYDEGLGRGEIKPGVNAGDFFKKFAAEQKVLKEKVGKVKSVMKMYAIRNNGFFPTDAFNDDSGFFEDDNSLSKTSDKFDF
ncbi:MAG: FecR domain-containing protein [Spirochaetales bacterium]|nr:FecR domain-containing protein [Spirochaetales bacterium]